MRSDDSVLDCLRRYCIVANREAFTIYGDRATCILTSATLRDVLEARGFHAGLLRVCATVFAADRCTIAGSDGDGTRRPATAPGKWRGHLTVVVEDRYLLDPTLDQLHGASPFAAEVTDAFLRGEESLSWIDGVRCLSYPGKGKCDWMVRYRAFPSRGGWKSAPDFRISRRRELAQAILAAV